jgi:hypothetical protein
MGCSEWAAANGLVRHGAASGLQMGHGEWAGEAVGQSVGHGGAVSEPWKNSEWAAAIGPRQIGE